jgi:hypothetical protein
MMSGDSGSSGFDNHNVSSHDLIRVALYGGMPSRRRPLIRVRGGRCEWGWSTTPFSRNGMKCSDTRLRFVPLELIR